MLNMKRFALLSVLYIYLETGICIEESNISPVDANADLQSDRVEEWHRLVAKRNSAFKRLPAWSVYYGKRSNESPIGFHDLEGSDVERTDLENVVDNDIIGDNESDVDKIVFPASLMYYFLDQKLDDDNEKIHYSDDTKRAIFKRLQPWMSTYGKRRDLIDSGYNAADIDADLTEDLEDLSTIKRTHELSENIYEVQPEFGIDDSKRAPGWHATYGKRLPGWTATYGKRSPSWLSTYGKRLAGWTATYGKRAPTWSITYGKRLPGWTATYGKRVPWGATYGKRVLWGATYGKRVPWGATYGKRVPWGATYGKRVPWGATYGKRSQGWNALYGKRAPMWQAVYGKRDEYNTSEDDVEAEDTSSIEEKRSQAWSAFYGR